MSDGSVMSHSTHSELEVVRGGSHRDDLSYDDPFNNASAISGTVKMIIIIIQITYYP